MSEIKIDQTKEYVLDKAKEKGLVSFFAQPNELFLDMDNPKHFLPNEDVVQFLQQLGAISESDGWLLVTISNGGNRHVYFKLEADYPESVRIAWQAALGSDPIKESISAIQASELMDAAIVLFETPVQAQLVEEWRQKCLAKI